LYVVISTGARKGLNFEASPSFNSFTLKYNTDRLVYFESFSIAGDAFKREKQIKTGSRKKKIDLIIAMNPEWKDLFEILKGNQGEELINIKKALR
jgi:putative endonuclease